MRGLMRPSVTGSRRILWTMTGLVTFVAARPAVAMYGPVDRQDDPPRPEPRVFVETAGIVGLNYYQEEGFDEKTSTDPARYRVQSDGDTNYRTPQHPTKVGRWSRGYDLLMGRRGFGVLKLHTIYLRLPHPLKAGKTYAVEVGPARRDKTVELEYRGDLHTSRAVKVNQYGYLPQEAVKIAYVGDWLGSMGTLDPRGVAARLRRGGSPSYGEGPRALKSGGFYLYDVAAKRKVFSGEARPRPVKKDFHGEDLYELDFSEFNRPGRYVLAVPGVGASYEFRIARDAYEDIARMAFRSLYHQRCGIALQEKYTKWVRQSPCHRGKVEISEWRAFSGGGPFKELPRHATGKYLTDAWGGYHDAGDYDRQSRHFVVCTKLLQVYEAFPEAFRDGQYGIPEGGNGVPDILDEARWVIDWGIRMQTQDGGVRAMVETTSHPNWGVGPDSPTETAQAMYAPQPEPMSSLLFAAPAAKLARAFKGVGKAKDAARFLRHAKAAYEYAAGHAAELKVVKVDQPAQPDDMRAEAAIELYRTTGEERYHRDFLEHFRPLKKPEMDLTGWGDWRLLYPTFSYATAKEVELDERALEVSRAALRRAAEKMLSHVRRWGYRVARYSAKMWWGFGGAANYHEPFMYAYLALGEQKYRDAMVHQADTWLGVNPLGMCWITGAGRRSPVNNLHIPQMNDGVPEPVPGIMVYGPLAVEDGNWVRNQYLGTMYPPWKEIPKLRCFADMYPFASSTEFRMDVYQVQMVCMMLFMSAEAQAGLWTRRRPQRSATVALRCLPFRKPTALTSASPGRPSRKS